MFTGCSDVYRLLLKSGASTNVCAVYMHRTADIITALWGAYADANGSDRTYKGLALETVNVFYECGEVTQLALDNDCRIDSADDLILCDGPNFSVIGTNMADAHASASVDAVDHLSSIGWDLEEKNCFGQTPLLYVASHCQPQVAECLRFLLQRGARLDARDENGRGPLLSALSPPSGLSNWVDMTYVSASEEHDFDNYWRLNSWPRTEDRKHVRDCYDTESTLDPLTSPVSPNISRSTLSLDGVESSQLMSDHKFNVAAEQLTPVLQFKSDPDSGASPCAEESIPNSKDDEYIHCFDYYSNDHWIRNPIHVLKDRVGTTLKVLLEAGCDPNDLDYDFNSTNDYARQGLWPQWLWALAMTGYVFEEEHFRWIKRIDPA